jgi:hypothetical protein
MLKNEVLVFIHWRRHDCHGVNTFHVTATALIKTIDMS